ncbi:hypothetical protein C2857_006734 [Epichloe festucae Fl1]|uniref:G-protein coupled receptors family 2 profile 2 domain-containing protein n=1 Tax=Epichloe festucae (strain Fl1) TaxID=877507 RepID=A0A7S9KLU5_EPIFF|nr:hypothetical protein C2857_006734 [Epichloe festucae Fl1]
MPSSEHFTPDQVGTIITLERLGGSISLAAVTLIFLAYGLIRGVRNVQNTFIVFASVSNVGASMACIIAMDGLDRGKESSLCRAQSFLFEMFMQSDPWWSLAMAINVFLVFYFRTSPDSFRRWWWIYCVVCYGGPFSIALALLLVSSPKRGAVYGDATIWCWVDAKWDAIRIYTYYLLVWICIVGSLICYVLVGYHVFRSRNRLRSFSATRSRHGDHGQDGCYGTVTTEVQIIRSSAAAADVASPQKAHLGTQQQQQQHHHHHHHHPSSPAAQYFSTVSATPLRKTPESGPLGRFATATNSAASKFVVADPVKRAYLRTSLLFALSVLVTWIPSSLNRIYSWMQGQSPYQFHVATSAVLPLQGLWNSLIFFISSWDVVKNHLHLPRKLRPGPGPGPGRVSRRSRHDAGFAAADRTVVSRAEIRPSTGFDDDSATMGSDVELRSVEVAEQKAQSLS